MNYIIKLVIAFQTSKSELVFEDLVSKLSYLINIYKNSIPKYYQDDFEQELLECLLKVINRFRVKKMKTISVSLFNKDNLELLETKMFKNVNEILKNDYVLEFIEKYVLIFYLFNGKNIKSNQIN